MERGGVLTVSEKSNLYIANTTIYEGFAYSGGVAYLAELSQLVLKEIQIISLNAVINLFDCTSSSLTIENSKISQSQTNLFLLISSNFRIENTTIDNHKCNTIFQGCLIFALSESFLVINQMWATQIVSQTTDNIFVSFGKAIFQNIIMHNLVSLKMQGSCIGASSSKINMNNAFFSLFYGNCINLYDSQIELNCSTFENNIVYGRLIEIKGAFYCLNCMSYSIINTGFRNNMRTGALYLQQKNTSINQNQNYLNAIINCSFTANTADQYGGAIYSQNQMVLIENSTFEKNQAKNGGAIFIFIDGNHIYTLFL